MRERPLAVSSRPEAEEVVDERPLVGEGRRMPSVPPSVPVRVSPPLEVAPAT